jgi:predicted phage terminase large subunit-like protein
VPLPAEGRLVISVDATFKSSRDSDYVAMTVWQNTGACWYLLDLVRRRMGFTETLTQLRALCSRWPMARRVLVEEAANGFAVLDVLHREVPGIIGVRATESKEARAASVSPLCESGQVYLPEGAPWLDAYVTELAAFPRGAHDDLVDSTSMALRDVAAHVGVLALERGAFARPTAPRGPTDEFNRPLLRVVR